jgi:hypothetical protein
VRYSEAVQEAFLSEREKAATGPEGGGRRRVSLYDSDRSKEARARALLAAGPDAVLMDFPKGYVDRQGV